MNQKFLRLAFGPFILLCFLFIGINSNAQTLAFPEAKGFGRFAPGARAATAPQVYIVTNLNDSGAGSFRDAVSQPGRVIVFTVSGIIYLKSEIGVAANITIAGQTAPGEGIVLFGKRVTFSSSSNTIARYIRIRLGATDNTGKDVSGISNGANMIFDHMTFTWGMDEDFSINWDGKNTSPDNITIQNSIIGQGLHRNNHSAGGLIQPSGGKISLIGNLYTSNKTRNPKVKGINEFVNNVVYNWGNFGNTYGHTESGEAYIMGGDSEGISNVNIINNYFIGGPLTSNSTSTPFNRGNANFFLYGSGNYFDNNKDGVLNGALVPEDLTGYPTGDASTILSTPYDYPMKNPVLTAAQAFDKVIDSVGASYPKRDQVDSLLVAQLNSKGVEGIYLYRETDMPFVNGGVGNVFSAPAPLDTDNDGMPDAWEDAHALNKNDATDAVTRTLNADYLNIEMYINGLTSVTPPTFIIPPSNISFTSTSVETPPSSTVVLTWKDNSSNETNFVIERSADNISFVEIAQVASNVKTYTDENLIPNKTYYYRIKAIANTESSSYSATATIATAPIPAAPAKTTNPTPTNAFQYSDLNGGNSIALKWAGSTNTTTYSVYLGTDADNLTKLGDVAYVASPTYSASGLTAGTTYYWRIDAANDRGTATGDVWSFRTIAGIPQGMVGYYAFDETAADGTKITDSTTYQNNGVLGLNEDNTSIRVAGKVKGALDFSTASTDIYVVSVPNEDQLYLDKSSFSVSFWMKADASLFPTGSTSSYLLCKGSITKNATTGATGKRFNIEFKSGQFRFAIDDDVKKSELAYDAPNLFNNTWQHAVIERDVSDNTLKLYINGALVATKADETGGIGEASALVVGNIGELEFLSSANAPAPYKGQLDELKIFNYALTPQQVLQQYVVSPFPLQASNPSPVDTGTGDGDVKTNVSWSGGINTTTYKIYFGTTSGALNNIADQAVATSSYQFTGLTANTKYFWRIDAVGNAGTTAGVEWSFTTDASRELVADWHLDATTGTTITDSSPNAYNGTLDNVTAYQWEAGRLNNGLNIQTNTNGAITVADNPKLKFDKTSFSVSMWVKGSVSANSAYLFHKGDFVKDAVSGNTGKWYGVEVKGATLTFSVDCDDVPKSSATTPTAAILNNTWVHLVFVRNVADKTLKIYKDGVQMASTTEVATSLANGIGNVKPLLFSNGYGNSAPFTGSFDEIKIFNYALSPAEITTLSNAQSLPVNLISFTAKADGNSIKLDWSTASEQDNHHFTVEKSVDGVTFENIATLNGQGNSNKVSNYSVDDHSPINGNNYYRLTQFDNNGTAKVLGVRVVKFGLANEDVLVFPNPAVKHINIKVPANVKIATVSISNVNGTQIYKRKLTVQQNQILTVDLDETPKTGIYILTVVGDGFTQSTKIKVD